MIINSDTSKEMIICFSTDTTIVNNLSPISINNCAVQRIEHANILGVTISSNLTRNAHVESIVSKAGKRVCMLYQLKRTGVG